MRVIRTLCPTCGMVQLTAEEVQVETVPSSRSVVGPGSHYSFECPSCHAVVDRPADAIVVEMLREAGAIVARTTHPSVRGRFGHPEHPPSGPPFTLDDLLDLHLLLQRDDWFERHFTTR